MSSSPDIAGILENTKELDRLRKEQEEVLVEINKMHKKLQASMSFLLLSIFIDFNYYPLIVLKQLAFCLNRLCV